MKVLKCFIGITPLGIKINEIEEIIETVLYNEFAGQSKYTIGFINYRGREVQLLNLAKILKSKYKADYENQFILVLKDKPFGLVVDIIENIDEIEIKNLVDPELTFPNYDFIDKVFIKNNFPIYETDKIVGRLGNKDEKKRRKTKKKNS